jgi:hypothetical protein
MTPVPDQPLGFDRSVDCNLRPGPFVQLAQDGDITQFQFQVTDCAASQELIWNGAFTLEPDSEGWTALPAPSWLFQPYFGNVLHVPGTLPGNVTQALLVSDGVLISLTVTVNQTVGQCSLNIGGSGGITWSQSFTGAVSGTFTYWIVADGMEYVRFAASSSSDATFGQVSVKAYNTTFETAVLDESGAVVATDIPYNVYNGWVTFSLDWESAGLDAGCYTIEVYSPCDCSQNGVLALDMYTGSFGSACYEFGMGAGVGMWASVGASMSVYNSYLTYVGTGVPNTTNATLAGRLLCVGTEYAITYTVSGLANAQVRVQMGSTSGSWHNANGTYTDTLTPTVSGTLSFQAQSVGVAGGLLINAVSIEATTKTASETSQPVRYMPECCKTKQITICNDSNAFGMGFVGTGWAPSIRVPASMTRSNYGGERNKYTDSNGRSMTYYGTSRKITDLRFGAPDFVHDFVRLGTIADHLLIDGVEYFAESDEYPTMSRDEAIDMSAVTLPVSLKVELTRNRRIDDTTRGCGASGNELQATQKPDSNVITGGTRPKPDLSTSDEGQVITIDG